MHTHTSASDGAFSPSVLLDKARANQVNQLAITDHDTINGYLEGKSYALDLGIRLISGVELSAMWGKTGVHIVGLNFDPEHPSMTRGLSHQYQVRQERSLLISEKLQKVGVKNALEGASELALGIVCRPHFAQFLVNAGYVKSIDKAFKRYLGKGKMGDVPCRWPHMSEAISWIVQSGGIAVLAHPGKYRMTRVKLRALIQDFVEMGGQALEVVTGGQSTAESEYFAGLCTHYGLYASVGSDFHGPDVSWNDLGRIHAPPIGCTAIWSQW